MTEYQHIITSHETDLGLLRTEPSVEYVEYEMDIPTKVRDYIYRNHMALRERTERREQICGFGNRRGNGSLLVKDLLPEDEGRDDFLDHLSCRLDFYSAATGIKSYGHLRFRDVTSRNRGYWHQDTSFGDVSISTLSGEYGTYRILPHTPLREMFRQNPSGHTEYLKDREQDCDFTAVGHLPLWRSLQNCPAPSPKEKIRRTALVHSHVPGIISTATRLTWDIVPDTN